jgi:hypothetical protein
MKVNGIKFHENLSSGHSADRQTDRHMTKPKGTFGDCAIVPTKITTISNINKLRLVAYNYL